MKIRTLYLIEGRAKDSIYRDVKGKNNITICPAATVIFLKLQSHPTGV